MPKRKLLRLTIGIPAYGGQISANHAAMWLDFGVGYSSTWRERFEVRTIVHVDVNGTHVARNRLLQVAHECGADWLLMIDADTWVLGNVSVSLLRMIDEADHDLIAVVAAPVRMRQPPHEIAAWRRIDDQAFPVAEPLQRGFNEVDEVGAACMAVNMHAVNQANARFEFTEALSEDREFCRQMRAAGHRICVDGRVRTGHLSKPPPLLSE